jgi:4-amino-4-deoxy-L-arabinose transferase-like glycosyltransferase
MKYRLSDQRPAAYTSLIPSLFVIVLAGSAFLRLWRIDSMFHFMGDEGMQCLAEWRLVHGHLPLLGPSLSIGTMHLGPLFYYLAAGPLALANDSPVGPTVLVALFGLAAVLLLYLYLKPSVGNGAALGAAAAMGASFLMVEYSRRPWNPTLTPFFALAFLWSLIAWKRHSSTWSIAVAALLACLLQLQPVNLFFVPLLVLYVLLARPSWPSARTLAAALLLFLIISSPLIIYDSTHHFSNAHAWLDFFLHSKADGPVRHASSPRLLFSLFYRAYGVPIVPIAVVLTVATVLALLIAAVAYRSDGDTNWELVLPLLLLIIAAVGFEVYHKQVFEQYMVCLFVVPFVALGALLRVLQRWRTLGRLVAAAVIVGLVAAGVRDDWRYSFVTPQVTVADAAVIHADLQPDDTYSHVLQVDKEILRWAHGRPFDLRMASYLNTDDAYRYMLLLHGHTPRNASLTFLLVEPSSWPHRHWPRFARALAAHATRRARIGVVWLYEARGQPSVP